MKKIILSLLVLALAYTACKKDNVTTPDTKAVPTLQPTPTVTAKTHTSASCGGTILSNGGAEITVKGVCWSTSQNPTISNSKTSDGTGSTSYSSVLTGLTPSTKYYVRSYATNSAGTGYGTQVEFYTENESKKLPPSITTTNLSSITSTSVLCGGDVIDVGGLEITARGVCWSTSTQPTITDNTTSEVGGAGVFSSVISNLTSKTTYYVRAYATNSKGTAYGEEKTFTTLDASIKTIPTIKTDQISDIKENTAISGGNIISNGGSDITARGVCWSTSSNPTIADYKTSDGNGTGTFVSNLKDLTKGTTYYARAYATNSIGTAYGEEKSFTTTAPLTLPIVVTTAPSSITQTTATSGGDVTDDGGTNVTARGICISTSQNPTIANTKSVNGTGKGSFTSSITGLTANTTYYVRAYATNSVGTAYGSEVSFTTLNVGVTTIPTVLTSTASSITQTGAYSGVSITSGGGGTISASGVCWSTSTNPTTSNSKTTGGSGSITGLIANTTYYVRAYATNEVGTAYGSEVSFTTLSSVTIPTITTSVVSAIAQTTATSGVTVISTGGGTIGTSGVCWSLLQSPTIILSAKSTGGSGNITGLTANTTYYVRAYATNSAGTAYGNEVSFTTLANVSVTVPTLTTSAVSSITKTTATSGVTVINSGGATVTASGVCWSTSNNPTTSNSKSTGGSGSITGLSANTTYYVRAYATNSAGTAYGNEVSFTTLDVPTLTTSAVSAITQTTAGSGVNVTSDGGVTITGSGVCWSTSSSPTTALTTKTTGGSGSITGLTANTTYYVRAYATNSVGTAYGNELSFTTLTTVVTGPDLLITEFQAIGSFEFIEIYNTTNAELKLSDYSLAEIDVATGLPTKSVVRISTTAKNHIIKSGEYKIIVPDISGNKNLTAFMDTYGLTPSDTLGIIKLSGITKTDGGDDIVIIKYGTQTIVDQLGWTSAATLKPYYGGTTGAKENSAERNKFTGESTDGANWNKSLVTGTPGKKNSVMP